MSVIEPGPAGASPLVARIQAILMSPKTEWDRIDVEPATVQGLYTGYAMILAAIPAVAGLIGSLFPVCVFGMCTHRNPIFAVVGAIVGYAVSLAGTYVVALIANELAPSFGGQKNNIQALKLIIYSSTASWLAGVFGILPALAILGLVGLYSFYLMYLGSSRVMKVPEDRAVGYTVVTVVAAIVVYVIVGLITAFVIGIGAIGAAGAAAL